MAQRRRALDEQLKRRDRQKDLYNNVSKILDISVQWWGERDIETLSTLSDSEDEDLDEDSYVGNVFHPDTLSKCIHADSSFGFHLHARLVSPGPGQHLQRRHH